MSPSARNFSVSSIAISAAAISTFIRSFWHAIALLDKIRVIRRPMEKMSKHIRCTALSKMHRPEIDHGLDVNGRGLDPKPSVCPGSYCRCSLWFRVDSLRLHRSICLSTSIHMWLFLCAHRCLSTSIHMPTSIHPANRQWALPPPTHYRLWPQ